jgi:sugar lactone lactonase YvrE
VNRRQTILTIIGLTCLIIVLPVVLLLVQKQQESRTRAEKSTTLTLRSPQQSVLVGNPLSVDVMLDPGTNAVSIVELHIRFDEEFLEAADPVFTPNTDAFPVTIEQQNLIDGILTTTVSIGSESAKAITSESMVGTLHLKPIKRTTTSSQISFGEGSTISSIASSDSPAENVLATTLPIDIMITQNLSVACGTFRIPDANQPSAITSVGNEIWVTNNGSSGSISRLKADGTEAASPLSGTGISNPEDILVVNDTVWIANSGSPYSGITRFELDGTYRDQIISDLGVRTLTIVGDEIWAISGSALYRFDTAGAQIGSHITLSDLTDTNGIAHIGNEVWVSDTAGQKIIRLDLSGNQIDESITDAHLQAPADIIEAGNQVWVSNLAADGDITILTRNGEYINFFRTDDMYYPRALFAQTDRVWVTNLQNGHVLVTDFNGGLIPCNTQSPTPTITGTQSPTPPVTITPTGTVSPTLPPISDTACGTIPITGIEQPAGIARIGSEVWISGVGSNSVHRLQLNGLQKQQPLRSPELSGPINLLAVNNEIWVMNTGGYNIVRLGQNGEQIGEPITLTDPDSSDFSYPYDAEIVGDEVWVVDYFSSRIFRVTLEGTVNPEPMTLPGTIYPTGIFTVNDAVWIMAYVPSVGSQLIPFDRQTHELGDPIKITDLDFIFEALTVGDVIWVTGVDTKQQGHVIRMTPDGETLSTSLSQIEYPVGMTQVQNRIWVTDMGENLNKHVIHVFSDDGDFYPCPDSYPKVSFDMLLNGIGSSGDSINPASDFSNKLPLTKEREFILRAYDEETKELVAEGFETVSYNIQKGSYAGSMTLGQRVNGDVLINIHTPGFISQELPTPHTLAENTTTSLQRTSLIAGDINLDNALNILDYNILLDCGYGAITPLPMDDYDSAYNSILCYIHGTQEYADVNDNGTIDNRDYNLFIRELQNNRQK